MRKNLKKKEGKEKRNEVFMFTKSQEEEAEEPKNLRRNRN